MVEIEAEQAAGGTAAMVMSWSGLGVSVPDQATKRSFNPFAKKADKPYKPSGPRQILKDGSHPRDDDDGTEKVDDAVYGVTGSGALLAIMGGSGAGKTTLLNVLTQRNTGALAITGDVRINGQPVPASVMRSQPCLPPLQGIG